METELISRKNRRKINRANQEIEKIIEKVAGNVDAVCDDLNSDEINILLRHHSSRLGSHGSSKIELMFKIVATLVRRLPEEEQNPQLMMIIDRFWTRPIIKGALANSEMEACSSIFHLVKMIRDPYYEKYMEKCIAEYTKRYSNSGTKLIAILEDKGRLLAKEEIEDIVRNLIAKGRLQETRIVCEQHLKRSLTDEELLDIIRSDPENGIETLKYIKTTKAIEAGKKIIFDKSLRLISEKILAHGLGDEFKFVCKEIKEGASADEALFKE